MTEAGRKYLSDILIAIDLIKKFIQDTPDFNAYDADLKTQSAVKRQLVLIGEALNKLKKTEPDITIQMIKKSSPLEIDWFMRMTVLTTQLFGWFSKHTLTT